jgi:hypothetical protein
MRNASKISRSEKNHGQIFESPDDKQKHIACSTIAENIDYSGIIKNLATNYVRSYDRIRGV